MPTRTKSPRLSARKVPQQGRSRQLVEDILEGAIRVFDREGLDATTNRVAREAGVSVGSLYQYFPSKESLLLALAERHVGRVTELVERATAAGEEAESLSAFTRALVIAVVREHRDHTTLRPLLRAYGPRLPELAQRFEQCVADAERAIVAQIRRFRPDVPNPELRARLLVATVDGLIHGELQITVDVEEEIVALCCGYLERSL